jgi:ribosomal-protein-alanine N-acetyltransferase
MRVPDPAALEFFRLGLHELDALAELEGQCFTLPWSKEQIAGHLGLPNFAAFGLRASPGQDAGTEDGAGPAAYISFYHSPDELEILNLAVAPRWRRHGCGTRLLRRVLHMAAKKGIRRAVLEVSAGNAPARALYERLGFAQVGRRRGYYHDSGEDALVLEFVLEYPCPPPFF